MRTGFAGEFNVYRTMAHLQSRTCCGPGRRCAWHVVKESALGAERSELVILRAACRMGSPYEWAHHVTRARKLGMAEGASPPCAQPPGEDGLIARAVDAYRSSGACRPSSRENLRAWPQGGLRPDRDGRVLFCPWLYT